METTVRIRVVLLLAALAGCLGILSPRVVRADDGSSSASNPTELEEVMVTAQKRPERLEQVPLSVQLISGTELDELQISNTNQLPAAVSSLNYQQGNNPTNTNFNIRGIGTALFDQGVEGDVSVVLDGVVAARQTQDFLDLVDVDRVEVLSGPQGTLFGPNSTAGVISIVTADPAGV